MKIIESCLNGLILIEPRVFNDDRGYFFESYKKEQLEELGISESFVQDNISRSTRNTIRGLHYQVGEFAQGKLCQVLNGRVMDVALDIRASSPTYGEYKSFELSSENHLMLYIPPGFAHGFLGPFRDSNLFIQVHGVLRQGIREGNKIRRSRSEN
jgi:dTDP-4-dehydrorhamnose 3,5-epimerase